MILVSIIPRGLRTGIEPTKSDQASAYFQSLRSATKTWTDVAETTFQSPVRSYPVLFGREVVRGALTALDTEQDSTVLLYFPDDVSGWRYFYVFFWTDIHAVGAASGTLDDLRALVDSFELRSSPAGAPSKGCGPV